jgi:hypothetical protein
LINLFRAETSSAVAFVIMVDMLNYDFTFTNIKKREQKYGFTVAPN